MEQLAAAILAGGLALLGGGGGGPEESSRFFGSRRAAAGGGARAARNAARGRDVRRVLERWPRTGGLAVDGPLRYPAGAAERAAEDARSGFSARQIETMTGGGPRPSRADPARSVAPLFAPVAQERATHGAYDRIQRQRDPASLPVRTNDGALPLPSQRDTPLPAAQSLVLAAALESAQPAQRVDRELAADPMFPGAQRVAEGGELLTLGAPPPPGRRADELSDMRGRRGPRPAPTLLLSAWKEGGPAAHSTQAAPPASESAYHSGYHAKRAAASAPRPPEPVATPTSAVFAATRPDDAAHGEGGGSRRRRDPDYYPSAAGGAAVPRGAAGSPRPAALPRRRLPTPSRGGGSTSACRAPPCRHDGPLRLGGGALPPVRRRGQQPTTREDASSRAAAAPPPFLPQQARGGLLGALRAGMREASASLFGSFGAPRPPPHAVHPCAGRLGAADPATSSRRRRRGSDARGREAPCSRLREECCATAGPPLGTSGRRRTTTRLDGRRGAAPSVRLPQHASGRVGVAAHHSREPARDAPTLPGAARSFAAGVFPPGGDRVGVAAPPAPGACREQDWSQLAPPDARRGGGASCAAVRAPPARRCGPSGREETPAPPLCSTMPARSAAVSLVTAAWAPPQRTCTVRTAPLPPPARAAAACVLAPPGSMRDAVSGAAARRSSRRRSPAAPDDHSRNSSWCRHPDLGVARRHYCSAAAAAPATAAPAEQPPRLRRRDYSGHVGGSAGRAAMCASARPPPLPPLRQTRTDGAPAHRERDPRAASSQWAATCAGVAVAAAAPPADPDRDRRDDSRSTTIAGHQSSTSFCTTSQPPTPPLDELARRRLPPPAMTVRDETRSWFGDGAARAARALAPEQQQPSRARRQCRAGGAVPPRTSSYGGGARASEAPPRHPLADQRFRQQPAGTATLRTGAAGAAATSRDFAPVASARHGGRTTAQGEGGGAYAPAASVSRWNPERPDAVRAAPAPRSGATMHGRTALPAAASSRAGREVVVRLRPAPPVRRELLSAAPSSGCGAAFGHAGLHAAPSRADQRLPARGGVSAGGAGPRGASALVAVAAAPTMESGYNVRRTGALLTESVVRAPRCPPAADRLRCSRQLPLAVGSRADRASRDRTALVADVLSGRAVPNARPSEASRPEAARERRRQGSLLPPFAGMEHLN